MPTPGTPGHGERWALLLDVDGTLLEIEPTPDAVRVPPDLPGLLVDLRRRLGGALALVSGRPIAELDRLFLPERFAAAGVHGAELRHQAGGNVQASAGPSLAAAGAAFREFAEQHPGLRWEDKGSAVALHYRQAPHAAAAVQRLAADVAAGLGPEIELLHGKMVVELRPAGITKGNAVAALMERAPFADRRPVYAGDDATDEDAFVEVNRRGGLSIAVGERPSTGAVAGLDGPRDVRCWLADVAAALRTRT